MRRCKVVAEGSVVLLASCKANGLSNGSKANMLRLIENRLLPAHSRTHYQATNSQGLVALAKVIGVVLIWSSNSVSLAVGHGHGPWESLTGCSESMPVARSSRAVSRSAAILFSCEV